MIGVERNTWIIHTQVSPQQCTPQYDLGSSECMCSTHILTNGKQHNVTEAEALDRYTFQNCFLPSMHLQVSHASAAVG